MSLNIQKNVNLSSLTTLKIGGVAKYFVEIYQKDDLVSAIEWAKKNKIEVFFVSGGSNVVFNDGLISALIIKISNHDITIRGTRINCGSGASLAGILSKAVSNNLSGLEWAVGIPGSLGGAVRGNSGAFGSSISDSIETIAVYNINKENFQVFSKNDCMFNYRKSFFSGNKDLIIWRVTIKLREGNVNDIKDLIKKYLEHRRNTQPKLPSAGCVFRNLNFNDLEKWNKDLSLMAKDENVIRNNMVGAGWIIEKMGFKGKRYGDIKVSLEHANFLVNSGNGISNDFIKISNEIKSKAANDYRVKLDFEIEFFGFEN